MSGYIPDVFSDSLELYIGTAATGRAIASSTTLDTVVFTQITGQPAATTFTPADVGMPILLIGCGPVDPLMPDVWEVQGAPFHTTIASYVSPSEVTLTDPPDTSFFNTGFFNIVVYRRCLMKLDSFEVSKSIAPGTRDTFDFTALAVNNPYIDRFTTIAMGQPVYLRSTDPLVGDIFGGEIDTITTSSLVGTEGTFSWTCHCAAYDGIAGRRAVNPVFPQIIEGDCAEVFTRICLLYMSDEGVGVIPTSGPTISIGCPVGAYVNTPLDQVVQAIAAAGEEWYWFADVWRNFVLRPRTSTPAPWDIDDGLDLLAGQQPIQLELTETHDKLATFTYALGENILLNALNATIVGNGVDDTFNLPQKIAKVPTITLNGGPQTVGILGVETGKNWYWNQGSTTLTQDTGDPVLTAADTLVVAYQFTYAGVASSPNYAGAVERQRDEAGSGNYDHVIQVTQIVSTDELLGIAEAWSAQYGIPAKTAKISTLRPGIEPGQLQHIVLPDIGADDDFLVATTRLTSHEKVLQWDYTAFSGANVGNGITGLVQFINRGEGTLQLLQPLVPVTASQDPAPITGQNLASAGLGATITFPHSVTQGNLLVYVAVRNSSLGNPPTVTDTQGNTWTQARFAQTGGGFPNQISLLYTFASASGALTVSCATAECRAIMEFSGITDTSPVEVTGAAIGTTPPTLALSGIADLVVTGLCNVSAIPTVVGPEILGGYTLNTSQPGVAFSYAKPSAGSFTSTLADSGGSSASVFVSVAFKHAAGTVPPAQTVDVNVNPSGTVTQSGPLTLNLPVFGNGTPQIKVGTKTGNTNDVVTSDGSTTQDAPLLYDASGNATSGDPGQLVPPGGSTGEVLAKQSGTDFDADWIPNSAVSVTTKGDVQGFSTVPARIPVGADGEVLTADSGNALGVSWQAAGAGGSGLVLLETQTASSSAELDFTASISATYDEYVIEIVNLINGSAAFIGFQMSTNGGASYDTGNNYDYNGAFAYNSSQGQYGANATSAILFRNSATTLAANGSWNGTFRLFNPGGALYKQMQGQLQWYDSGVGIISTQIVGIWKNTAAMDAFRLAPDTGTFTSGVVRIYGVAK